jgi:hypothetical protein
MPDETAAGRWARDYASMEAGRKTAEWDTRPEGRKELEYVDYATRDPQGDVTGGIQGTGA